MTNRITDNNKTFREQIERIEQMEQRFAQASAVVKELTQALDAYEAIQETIATLDDYYGSEAWRHDLADDEAGRLPDTLRRGVLSEDGIWNLLSECHELEERLNSMAH